MKKLSLLLTSLVIGNRLLADQLDGLAFLDTLVYVLFVGIISSLVLFLTAIFRFSRKEYKVSTPLTISASIVLMCAFISIRTLGSGIDPGFLTFCIGIAILAIVLIILNYRVGIKRIKDQQDE
ncbi:hypothetical protein H9Y05_13985 [Crocinitomicaceae bacterium CZZ-1]|uniref:Uncharacterized protein n=1 Tax=Taishania pollutisoli TaxID=2766479 RepID=A0A8J6TTS9_9FLAO|nr:hypothetical protein [Taishania pollutisoli]MBC9813582.1 hypothetical protein [Taishania pollutisoli]